jgi:hypothetical protein
VIGVYRPPGTAFNDTTSSQWLLRAHTSDGTPDIAFSYGSTGDIPVVGNWDGNIVPGCFTAGVFRPAGTPFNQTTGGQWLLRNSNSAGDPDVSFSYGAAGDVPVVGDWDGNGTTTVGVFRPAGTPFNQTTEGQWLLRNSNSAGDPEITFVHGAPGDVPVFADWDGDGITTIGVFRPSTGEWLLRNSNSAGNADIWFIYGAPDDIPVVGDWDENGTDTIGVFRPAGSQFNETTGDQWLLRNSNSGGDPDLTFSYGAAGDLPVVVLPHALADSFARRLDGGHR